jgi:chemotaxis protein methyltransferase CheR
VAPAPAPVRIELRSGEFDRARRLIHEIAGITMSPTKRTMVANRLSRRLRETGHASFDAYLDAVEADGSPERENFTNALTTNLTSFFREAHHFPILVEHLRKPGNRAKLTVWSAACSTGEEPYSIAMALSEANLPQPFRVIASDVDTAALERAQAGVYPLAKAEAVGPDRLRRFFQRGDGPYEGFARVRPEIRALVEFRNINLHDAAWPVEGPMEAIFCRNAMIYFARPEQLAVLERFAPLLAGGGLLFAGHSENFHYVAGGLLRTLGHTVYAPTGAGR